MKVKRNEGRSMRGRKREKGERDEVGDEESDKEERRRE